MIDYVIELEPRGSGKTGSHEVFNFSVNQEHTDTESFSFELLVSDTVRAIWGEQFDITSFGKACINYLLSFDEMRQSYSVTTYVPFYSDDYSETIRNLSQRKSKNIITNQQGLYSIYKASVFHFTNALDKVGNVLAKDNSIYYDQFYSSSMSLMDMRFYSRVDIIPFIVLVYIPIVEVLELTKKQEIDLKETCFEELLNLKAIGNIRNQKVHIKCSEYIKSRKRLELGTEPETIREVTNECIKILDIAYLSLNNVAVKLEG